jgi:tellurite resistance protein TerC
VIWLWLGFFALVALLLVIDLGVLHRKQVAPTMASALGWTIVWVALGLAFTGAVYLLYDDHICGATLPNGDGSDAAITYVSAYLLEQALSVDNLFVISLVFAAWKIPPANQHRVLFWGILGAIVFRLGLLSGGALIAEKFHWVFYIFGAYLAFQGGKMLFSGDDDDSEGKGESRLLKFLRRFVRIVEGSKHEYTFTVRSPGHFAITTVLVCLIVIELTDIVFALDSIPAVMTVSHEPFIMVTSNVFAVLGLRSLYFVLAGAMAKFKYLKLALGFLLIVIGAKMLLHRVDMIHELSNAFWLGVIAGVLAIGVVASVLASRGAPAPATGEPRA